MTGETFDDQRRLAVSFVIDGDPVFAYTGWNLAHSLKTHLAIEWRDIHVQFISDVACETVDAFQALGCSTHELSRFGDGKYCNKLAQWDNLRAVEADVFLFLDTDMICVANFAELIPSAAIGGKVVDLDNPRLPTLDTIFAQAGFSDRPPIIRAEARDAPTYRANCNGGFYSVPRQFADTLFDSWRRHALELLGNNGPLASAGKESHVDQVAFCMAVHETALPFENLPSNLNYFLHFQGEHTLLNAGLPLCLLHYHNASIDVLGLLAPAGAQNGREQAAVEEANRQIRNSFNTRFFWDLRYKRFPERGSGVGSRGYNLQYKREILRAVGAESAGSVLDIGCGDLEVVHALDLHNYTGIDQSAQSLALAASRRPDWRFLHASDPNIPSAELVLCFEVAIHQRSLSDYRRLIQLLADRTARTLIVSGYDEPPPNMDGNHMLFFHETLRESLRATGKFASVLPIGAHSTVTIYRCDVG